MADDDPARRVLTLTTDFGLADPYVAAMKGVILGMSPRVTIVDISHDVQPQQLRQAVYISQSAWPYFPESAVHVVVVDPGVGTERRAVVLETPRGLFVGPDNGVLSAALPDEVLEQAGNGKPVALPAGCRAFAITSRELMREPVSATFHGRDIFAPVAAHLSLGLKPGAVGSALDAIVGLPPLRASRCEDGSLRGEVLHIDRFGNVVTDARAEDAPPGRVAVEVASRVVLGLVRTYADAEGLTALTGSSGYIELAVPGGSAAAVLGAKVGDPVVVRRA